MKDRKNKIQNREKRNLNENVKQTDHLERSEEKVVT